MTISDLNQYLLIGLPNALSQVEPSFARPTFPGRKLQIITSAFCHLHRVPERSMKLVGICYKLILHPL
jgi:hypothetical protein